MYVCVCVCVCVCACVSDSGKQHVSCFGTSVYMSMYVQHACVCITGQYMKAFQCKVPGVFVQYCVCWCVNKCVFAAFEHVWIKFASRFIVCVYNGDSSLKVKSWKYNLICRRQLRISSPQLCFTLCVCKRKDMSPIGKPRGEEGRHHEVVGVIFIPVPLVMVHGFHGAPNKTKGIRWTCSTVEKERERERERMNLWTLVFWRTEKKFVATKTLRTNWSLPSTSSAR